MSFILEALKKSHKERQVKALPDLDYWLQAPTSAKPVNWVVVLLLAILVLNLVLVAGWLTRSLNVSNILSGITFDFTGGAQKTQSLTSVAETLDQTPPPWLQAQSQPEQNFSAPVAWSMPTPRQQDATWLVDASTTQVVEANVPDPAAAKFASTNTLEDKLVQQGYEVIRPGGLGQPNSMQNGSIKSEFGTGGQTLPSYRQETIPSLTSLSQDIQEMVPAFEVVSHIYTQAPQRRAVILNNSLFREGDEITYGLLLEGIESDHLVFSYLGTHFRYDVKL